MGHGTEADSNQVYAKMQTDADRRRASTTTYVGTVEATPSLDDVLAAVQAGDYDRMVPAEPLMIVAGDHANNDMAGDEEDSWKTAFEAAGYEVDRQVSGLGELEAIQQLLVRTTPRRPWARRSEFAFSILLQGARAWPDSPGSGPVRHETWRDTMEKLEQRAASWQREPDRWQQRLPRWWSGIGGICTVGRSDGSIGSYGDPCGTGQCGGIRRVQSGSGGRRRRDDHGGRRW